MSRKLTTFEVVCLARCALLGNQGAKRWITKAGIAPIVVIGNPARNTSE